MPEKTLLRAALWYLNNWRNIPVFFNIYKVPLVKWDSLYLAEPDPGLVVRMYNEVVRSGRKPAAIALLPSSESRTVFIDLDIYRSRRFRRSAEEMARELSDTFVTVLTPRGGLRLVFENASEQQPYRFTVSYLGDPIGEGGGAMFKHFWHMPPGHACVLDRREQEKCTREHIRPYVFVTGRGTTKYPWETPWERPPRMTLDEAIDILRATYYLEFSVEERSRGRGGVVVKEAAGSVRLVPPCWENLDEFRDWLRRRPYPPLPACVAAALGYEVTPAGMRYTGRKVPEGMRFSIGAAAVVFLAACVADFDPRELIDMVGEHLEGYPADTGVPLDRKLSYLIARAGNIYVPRYTGLGSMASAMPPQLCERCPYKDPCIRGGARRFVLAYSARYWRAGGR